MLAIADTPDRLRDFQSDLTRLSALEVVRKHIIHGDCEIVPGPSYFDLRAVVAAEFEVHPNEVLVVGSAKLGFSIAPGKRYRPFCDESDIDVVIVSALLFDDFWGKVYAFREAGGYWEKFEAFKKYLFQGWIRPDMLPPDSSFVRAKRWWEFFNQISNGTTFSRYKIRGALYKNWYFLESYQQRAVSLCMSEPTREGG